MEVASPLAPIDTPSKTWGTVATILRQNEQLSEVDLIVSDEINSDIKDTFGPIPLLKYFQMQTFLHKLFSRVQKNYKKK